MQEIEADIQRIVRYRKKLLVEQAWSSGEESNEEQSNDDDGTDTDDEKRALQEEEERRAREYAARFDMKGDRRCRKKVTNICDNSMNL